MPINDFLVVHSGKEGAWASPAVASAKRMAITEAKFKPRGKTKIFKELRGSLARGYLAGKTSIAADLHMAGYGAYEDLAYHADAQFGIAAPGSFGGAAAGLIAIASSTNATPIVVTTSAAHGLSTGQQITVNGHATNTNANGTWTITVLSGTTFSLNGSTGNGVGAATGSINAVAIASSTNATPIVVTTGAAHGLTSGDVVQVVNHANNTAANGYWPVTVLSATTFSLLGSVGNGIGGATGSVVVAAYRRAYAAPAGTAPTLRYDTFHYGDATYTYRMVGAMMNKLSLAAKSGENDTELTWNADWLAKMMDGSGALGALSDRAQNPIMGSDVLIFVDDFSSPIGTTLIPTTFYNFDLNTDANRILKRYLGSYYPGNVDGKPWEVAPNNLKMLLEVNATSKAYLDVMISTAVFQKKVRIAFGFMGQFFRFDFAGTAVDDPDIFTDHDGVASIEFTLQQTVNSTGANPLGNWFTAAIGNNVSALP